MNIINCTPHDVHFYSDKDGELIATIEKSNMLIRIAPFQKEIPFARIKIGTGSIPVVKPENYDKMIYSDDKHTDADFDFNMIKPNRFYIVSGVVLEFLEKTKSQYIKQFLSIDSSPDSAVRDKNGKIIGATRFTSYGLNY